MHYCGRCGAIGDYLPCFNCDFRQMGHLMPAQREGKAECPDSCHAAVESANSEAYL